MKENIIIKNLLHISSHLRSINRIFKDIKFRRRNLTNMFLWIIYKRNIPISRIDCKSIIATRNSISTIRNTNVNIDIHTILLINITNDLSHIFIVVCGNQCNIIDIIKCTIFLLFHYTLDNSINTILQIFDESMFTLTISGFFTKTIKNIMRKKNSWCSAITNSSNDSTSDCFQIIPDTGFNTTREINIPQNCMTIFSILRNILILTIACCRSIWTKWICKCIRNNFQSFHLNFSEIFFNNNIRVDHSFIFLPNANTISLINEINISNKYRWIDIHINIFNFINFLNWLIFNDSFYSINLFISMANNISFDSWLIRRFSICLT